MVSVAELAILSGVELARFGGLKLEAIIAEVAGKSLRTCFEPEMLEIPHPGRFSGDPEGVEIAFADAAPILERYAELEARPGRADELALVRPEEMVEGAGRGDSPTPIVPISSDSTRAMSIKGPNCRASAVAASQPAVPPPAITTRFTFCPSKSPSSFSDSGD
jgi:hypothetical protein